MLLRLFCIWLRAGFAGSQLLWYNPSMCVCVSGSSKYFRLVVHVSCRREDAEVRSACCCKSVCSLASLSRRSKNMCVYFNLCVYTCLEIFHYVPIHTYFKVNMSLHYCLQTWFITTCIIFPSSSVLPVSSTPSGRFLAFTICHSFILLFHSSITRLVKPSPDEKFINWSKISVFSCFCLQFCRLDFFLKILGLAFFPPSSSVNCFIHL